MTDLEGPGHHPIQMLPSQWPPGLRGFEEQGFLGTFLRLSTVAKWLEWSHVTWQVISHFEPHFPYLR